MKRIGSVYVATSAVVTGNVTFGEGCNVWPGCVIRGDAGAITVGKRVTFQDGAIVHCNYGVPMTIGDEVAFGHGAIMHGKRVGDRSLIGIGATILEDCEIGEECLIAGGAVVAGGTLVPDGSVVMGIPGKVVRPIRDEDRDCIAYIVDDYADLAQRYVDGEFPPYTG